MRNKTTEFNSSKEKNGAVEPAERDRRVRAARFRAALTVLAALFLLLAVLAHGTATFSLDVRITRFLQSMDVPAVTRLMEIVSWPGYSPQSFLMVAVAAIALAVARRRWEAAVCLLSAGVEELLNLLVKLVVHRPRPSADLVHVFRSLSGYSFPSGHVMFYTCFFGFLCFLAYTLPRPSAGRAALVALFGLPVLLVGPSRVYLGEHWASDALGAYLLGAIALIVVVHVYHWGKSRFIGEKPHMRR